MTDEGHLSRRERQIMDAIFRLGKATASDVLAGIPDPPTRTAVRTMLGILEEKGEIRHEKRGREFVYETIKPRKKAGRSAMKRVLETFFSGSLGQAVAAHLSDPEAEVGEDELARLAELVRGARKRSR
jgi:predicted transcriptional regulator